MSMTPATTSQTVRPFFSIGLTRLYETNLALAQAAGERVTIAGRVIDGDGIGVPDAMLELWQANVRGKYAHPEDTQDKMIDPHFLGFGRIPTATDGAFRFTTIKPGQAPDPRGKLQAPHIVVSVFMRGLLRRLVTRIYFPDEHGNADDFVLNRVVAERRSTLLARRTAESAVLHWDVMLQGANETVFFDC